MGTLWLGGAEGLICPKFYTDNHKHPPPLGHCRPRDVIHPPKIWKTPLLLDIHKHPPPLGHCLCDVIIHIPKGLICSFLWPIFSSCFARISPTVCPNFTHCLPEFGGGQLPPPPAPRLIRLWGYLECPGHFTVLSEWDFHWSTCCRTLHCPNRMGLSLIHVRVLQDTSLFHQNGLFLGPRILQDTSLFHQIGPFLDPRTSGHFSVPTGRGGLSSTQSDSINVVILALLIKRRCSLGVAYVTRNRSLCCQHKMGVAHQSSSICGTTSADCGTAGLYSAHLRDYTVHYARHHSHPPTHGLGSTVQPWGIYILSVWNHDK